MSGGALALWWAANVAAVGLQLGGWALLGIAAADCIRTVQHGARRRRSAAVSLAITEIAAAGFVLNQIGVIAGLILLDMKGP